MIIAAVIPLFEYHIVPMLWKTKKIDLVTMAVTFLVCFYETELGILAGVAVALCIFVYESVQLRLTKDIDGSRVIFRVESQNISYPSIENLVSKLDKVARSKKSKPDFIVLDMKNVIKLDSTSAMALYQFWISLKARDINAPKLVFRNVKRVPQTVLGNIGIAVDEEIEFNSVAAEVDSGNQVGAMDDGRHRIYPQLNQNA